jgi:hypothetical protein
VNLAQVPAGTPFHALRHYYASLLIRHGESVKVVPKGAGGGLGLPRPRRAVPRVPERSQNRLEGSPSCSAMVPRGEQLRPCSAPGVTASTD